MSMKAESENKLPLREAIAKRLHELQCDRAHCDDHCRDDFEYEAADEILAMVALEKVPAISNSAEQSKDSAPALQMSFDCGDGRKVHWTPKGLIVEVPPSAADIEWAADVMRRKDVARGDGATGALHESPAIVVSDSGGSEGAATAALLDRIEAYAHDTYGDKTLTDDDLIAVCKLVRRLQRGTEQALQPTPNNDEVLTDTVIRMSAAIRKCREIALESNQKDGVVDADDILEVLGVE